MGFCERLDRCNQSRARAWVGIVIGILEMFFFGGFHYGYNAIVSPYQNLSVFESYKNKNPDQDKMFSYAFTVWLVSQMLSSFLFGWLLDKIGLRAVKFMSVCLYSIGTFMFAFTNGQTSGLYFPAGIFVAIASTSEIICNTYLGSPFPKFSGLIVAMICGAFDSSAAIPFIISKTFPTISLQTSFVCLACFALIVGSIVSVFFMTTWGKDMKPFEKLDFNKNSYTDSKMLDSESYYTESKQAITNEIAEVKQLNLDDEINQTLDYIYPTLRSCIVSWPFVLVTLYFMFGLTRFSYFLGQLSKQLEFKFPNDEKLQLQLQQNSAIFSMSAFLFSPLLGLIISISCSKYRKKLKKYLEKYSNLTNNEISPNFIYWTYIKGMGPAFLLKAITALLLSILIFIPSEIAFYCAFICFTVTRSLVFSGSIMFCRISFPAKYFGTVNGLVNMIGGLFSLIQYGLFELNENIGNGIALAMSVCLFIVPIVLFVKQK